jgi:8-oxo-dGTP diphosphatase
LGIALILVKNPVTKKYLAVHEKDGSWWLPGGRIDAPELFSKGAVRETKEEGGVDVKIKGVLRFELAPNTQFIRNKSTIFL